MHACGQLGGEQWRGGERGEQALAPLRRKAHGVVIPAPAAAHALTQGTALARTPCSRAEPRGCGDTVRRAAKHCQLANLTTCTLTTRHLHPDNVPPASQARAACTQLRSAGGSAVTTNRACAPSRGPHALPERQRHDEQYDRPLCAQPLECVSQPIRSQIAMHETASGSVALEPNQEEAASPCQRYVKNRPYPFAPICPYSRSAVPRQRAGRALREGHDPEGRERGEVRAVVDHVKVLHAREQRAHDRHQEDDDERVDAVDEAHRRVAAVHPAGMSAKCCMRGKPRPGLCL